MNSLVAQVAELYKNIHATDPTYLMYHTGSGGTFLAGNVAELSNTYFSPLQANDAKVVNETNRWAIKTEPYLTGMLTNWYNSYKTNYNDNTLDLFEFAAEWSITRYGIDRVLALTAHHLESIQNSNKQTLIRMHYSTLPMFNKSNTLVLYADTEEYQRYTSWLAVIKAYMEVMPTQKHILDELHIRRKSMGIDIYERAVDYVKTNNIERWYYGNLVCVELGIWPPMIEDYTEAAHYFYDVYHGVSYNTDVEIYKSKVIADKQTIKLSSMIEDKDYIANIFNISNSNEIHTRIINWHNNNMQAMQLKQIKI